MTDTEKRRQELLHQARQIYDSRSSIPAVHPRYGAVYDNLYGSENEKSKTTLATRIIIAMLLFVIYAGIDMQDLSIGSYKSSDIAEVVSNNIVLHMND